MTTKPDLKKICPELVAIEWVDTDADKTNQRHCPLCFNIEDGHADDCEYPAIAARMLELAEFKDDVKAVIEERDVVNDDCALLDRIQLLAHRKGD